MTDLASIAAALSEAQRDDLIAIRRNRTLVRRGLMERSFYAGHAGALTATGAALRDHLLKERG